MGKFSIEDLIKIIKVVRTIKDKKKRRKRRRQIKKMLEAQGIKSLSSHMTGSANTHQTNLLSEALNIANKSNEQKINQNKQLEDNKNEERIKALMNSHDEFITNANKYAFNTDNSLNDINNKLDRLENRSFNTYDPNIKVDYYDSNDVPNVKVDFHPQTLMENNNNVNDNVKSQTIDNTISTSSIKPQEQNLSYGNNKSNSPYKFNEENTNYETPKRESEQQNIYENETPYELLDVAEENKQSSSESEQSFHDLPETHRIYETLSKKDYKKYKVEIDNLYKKYIEICNKNGLIPKYESEYFAIKPDDNYQNYEVKLKSLKDNIVYANVKIDKSVEIPTPQKNKLTKLEYEEFRNIIKQKYDNYNQLCIQYNLNPKHDYIYYSIKKHDTFESYKRKLDELNANISNITQYNRDPSYKNEPKQGPENRFNVHDYNSNKAKMRKLFNHYLSLCKKKDLAPINEYSYFSVKRDDTPISYEKKLKELQNAITLYESK